MEKACQGTEEPDHDKDTSTQLSRRDDQDEHAVTLLSFPKDVCDSINSWLDLPSLMSLMCCSKHTKKVGYSQVLFLLVFLCTHPTSWIRLKEGRQRNCADCASKGHLSLLIWAVENGWKVDRKTTSTKAAQNRHLDVLHWLDETGRLISEGICRSAALCRHVNVLK